MGVCGESLGNTEISLKGEDSGFSNILKVRIAGPGSTDIKHKIVAKLTIPFLNGKEMHCTGMLIDRKNLLTAASCFEFEGVQADIAGIRVEFLGVGKYWEPLPAVVMGTEKVIKHEDYNPKTFENNIAILTLDREREDGLTYTKLHDKGGPLSGDTEIIGYGVSSKKEKAGGEKKLKSLLYSFYMVANCNDFENHGKSYCYEVKKGRGACYGDMGGPLVSLNGRGNTIVGITSHIYSIGKRGSCVETGDMVFFTLVSKYIDWIWLNAGTKNSRLSAEKGSYRLANFFHKPYDG
ncbi:Collagenase [Smittium mucronatum]|uniref:Collagenase n=1 Tax=Smittium mucronatum TaxID=133383 RepID=A0A1R0H2H5_9FUNG|nr:Collagenase [Smittium mucronatum]